VPIIQSASELALGPSAVSRLLLRSATDNASRNHRACTEKLERPATQLQVSSSELVPKETSVSAA